MLTSPNPNLPLIREILSSTAGGLRAWWEAVLQPVRRKYDERISAWLRDLSYPDDLFDLDDLERDPPPSGLVPDTLAVQALDLAADLARPPGYEEMLTLGVEPTEGALDDLLAEAARFDPAAYDWRRVAGPKVGARLNGLCLTPSYYVPED